MNSENNNFWAEINGGLRGSILLRIGALFTIAATAQNLLPRILETVGEPSPGFLVTTAWLSWIAALMLLAAGFIWVGVQPFFSRFGLLIGIFHLLNGVFLMVVLFARVPSPLPGVSLAIGRTLLLLFFGLLEKSRLRPFTTGALITVAGLQSVKIALRLLDWMPAMSPLLVGALDSLILTLIALALYLVGGDIRKAEDQWARELASTRASGFGEFNNPEHDWNRSED